MSDIIPAKCQVQNALSVLSGKWNPVILLELLSSPVLRFSELKRRIPGIIQKKQSQG